MFESEIFGCSEGYVNVGWSKFGMLQGWLLSKGNMAILGLKPERIPGATFADKRTAVLQMNLASLNAALADGGFFVRFRDSVSETSGRCLLAVPSNFLLAIAGSNVEALRWSFMADESDTARVRFALQNLVDSFPEFRGAGCVYVNLVQHFGLRVAHA